MSYAKLLDALQADLPVFQSACYKQISSRVNRYAEVDKLLEKSRSTTKAAVAGAAANAAGKLDKIRDIEVPLAQIQKETYVAYLTGTFCTGMPMFAAVTGRQHEDGATMLNTLTKRDQQRLGWVDNFMRVFEDVVKFNVCAVECSWKTVRGSGYTTSVVEGESKTGAFAPIVYEGVEFKRLDPYNTFYDTRVEPSKVHKDGAFVGYLELMDHFQLKKHLGNLDQAYIHKENYKKFLDRSIGVSGQQFFQRPDITQMHGHIDRDPEDFTMFFPGSAKPGVPQVDHSSLEVFTSYSRISPELYGIPAAELGNLSTDRIFHLIWIDGHLLYAEPLVEGHEFLPIIVGQLYSGYAEKKSLAEYQEDMQSLSSSVINGALGAMRRTVLDRAVYDGSRITETALQAAETGNGKIKVSGNSFQAGVSNAYQQIPFHDTVSGNFTSMYGLVRNLSDQTAGANQSAQGSFIPGNKTQFEFGTIMSNSEARMQLGALKIATTLIEPCKEIAKLYYLVNAVTEQVEDKQLNKKIAIDPALLREEAPSYAMADGLMPTTKIASTEVMAQAMQIMQSDPKLSLEYDTGAIILSVLKQQGFTDINQYRRTPEEMQQYAQLVGAMNGQPRQPSPSGANASGSPENAGGANPGTGG